MAVPGMTPSALALDDPDFYLADPHAAFRWMRERAPVYRCERARLWAISKHADILQVVARNPETFCSARGVLIHDGLRGDTPMEVPPSIIYMDPPPPQPVPQARQPRLHAGDGGRSQGRIRAIAREKPRRHQVRRGLSTISSRWSPSRCRCSSSPRCSASRPEDREQASSGGPMRSSPAADTGTSPESMQHVGELFAYFHGKARRTPWPAARPTSCRRSRRRRWTASGSRTNRGPDVLHDAARRRQRDDAQPPSPGGARALMRVSRTSARALVANPDRLPGARSRRCYAG